MVTHSSTDVVRRLENRAETLAQTALNGRDTRLIKLLETAAKEITSLRASLATASGEAAGARNAAIEEMENYRLALAWIKGQSTDPQAKEIAATALDAYSVPSPQGDTP